MKRGRFTTPRHGPVSAAHYLTVRGLRDLPTQIRFEQSTPDEVRTGQMTAEFVEYLIFSSVFTAGNMELSPGYPHGWTEVP